LNSKKFDCFSQGSFQKLCDKAPAQIFFHLALRVDDEKIQLKHPIIESEVSGKRGKKQLFDKRLNYFTFLSSSIISPNAFGKEEEESSNDPESQNEETTGKDHN
jgi:hypothetical protein